MNERAHLTDLLAAAGVDASHIERLAHYGELLLETNRRFNVSGADTPEELAPHIVDSLSVAGYVQSPLVDVGSGGGLPAIPVAILTGVAVTMVESTTKKAAFLEAVLAQLGLVGSVVPERAEIAARHDDLREKFACATARAVSGASTVLELTLPFVRVGGTVVLQRGRLDQRERNAVTDAAPMLGGELAEEISLDGDKRILLLRKVAPTPQRFPRRTGVPEKRPLCM